ncbi:MAG TPA: glycerophosphodiester phosphodiesterase family protein [Marmoricola sp.]|nr:glycerophosphodiester phosphodiesterase family protein [Marmoricola sp.]
MSRPAVIAHRGASATDAEHTLAAYLRAIQDGADGLECDVRLTADGHLVCVHDRDLRRTAAQKKLVSSSNLADLAELDFASWKNPWADLDDEATERDPELSKVLTMRRLLEVVASADRRIELAIETKHPTRYAGLVERRLVELLAEFGWTGSDSPVRVMSFSWVAVKRVERLAPSLDVVYLMDRPGAWARSRPVASPDWIAGPGIELLQQHPVLIRRIGRKSRVHVWTVNTAADIDLCLDLGVEAIITDRPAFASDYLDAAGL